MLKKGANITGILVTLLAIVAVVLTGCTGATPLTGKWQYGEYEETYYLEFFTDGQAEMSDEYIVISCPYEETGDKEITLTLVGINGEAVDEEDVVLEYNIIGDELTLDDGKDPITFTRAK